RRITNRISTPCGSFAGCWPTAKDRIRTSGPLTRLLRRIVLRIAPGIRFPCLFSVIAGGVFMWFRNLQCYRLPRAWRVSADELEEQLGRRRFQPCGSQDLEVRGWASPTGGDSLVHRVGGQWL